MSTTKKSKELKNNNVENLQWYEHSENMNSEKMQWYVDAYYANKGQMEYEIQKTYIDKGSVIKPTGTGKSCDIYDDIIHRINNLKKGERLVVSISAPILQLCAQLVNDAIYPIATIFDDMCKNGSIKFFVNSSANDDAFCAEKLKSKVFRMDEFESEFLYNKDMPKIAFITSCHKSLSIFAEYIPKIAQIVNLKSVVYIDECHKWENDRYYTLLDKICKCNNVYGLTATPDEKWTRFVMEKSVFYDKKSKTYDVSKNPLSTLQPNGKDYFTARCGYIIHKSASEMIKDGKILPPNAFFTVLDKNSKLTKITSEMCVNAMNIAKREIPNIPNKLLVTCTRDTDVDKLANELTNIYNYHVFKTTSLSGCGEYANGGYNEIEMINFCKKVDAYDDDCFVIHIRRLTQGIDINSLTGTMIFNGSHIGDSNKRGFIQNIGRTLRPYKNGDYSERGLVGMEQDNRKKRWGLVFFTIKECDSVGEEEKVERQTKRLLTEYYGTEYMRFNSEIVRNCGSRQDKDEDLEKFPHFDKNYEDDDIIDPYRKMLIDIEDEVNRLVDKYSAFKNHKLKDTAKNAMICEIKEYLETIKNKYCPNFGSLTFDLSELLSDPRLVEVNNKLKGYEIELNRIYSKE